MPFRSEAEQIREQIRRLEEQASELRKEQAELQRQAGRQRHPARWGIALLVAFGLSGSIGFGGGSLIASTRSTRIRAEQEANEAVALDQELTLRTECRRMSANMSESLTACQREREDREALANLPDYVIRDTPALGPAFDRVATTAALAAKEPQVNACIKPPRDVSVHTTITFLIVGEVQSVVIDGRVNADGKDVELSDAERNCITTILRTVKIPSFGGMPTRVGKSWQVMGKDAAHD